MFFSHLQNTDITSTIQSSNNVKKKLNMQHKVNSFSRSQNWTPHGMMAFDEEGWTLSIGSEDSENFRVLEFLKVSSQKFHTRYQGPGFSQPDHS